MLTDESTMSARIEPTLDARIDDHQDVRERGRTHMFGKLGGHTLAAVSRLLVLALGALLISACGGDDEHPCSGCLVDAPAPSDGSRDGSEPSDAPITSGCPASFASVAGGQGTHRYRLINATDDWSEQVGTCAATSSSAYLAIPDDAAELAAIAMLSAASASWVGISDTATENVFVTVKGAAATFLPWDGGQPDNSGGEDCVMVQTSSSKLRDEKCSTKLRAVCECEP